jgi:hypothetical protein
MNLLVQLVAMVVSLFIIWLFFMIFIRPRYNEKKITWLPMCPKCGSLNVKRHFLSTTKRFFFSLNPNQFKCNSCKFIGFFPEVDVERIEEVRKKYVKGQKDKKPLNKKTHND